jgi:integrase
VSRQNLTDRFIKSRGKAPDGTRVDYQDAVVSGLALRVTDRGHKSFVLVARYPLQPKNPTRRALGDCYIPKKGEASAGREIRNGALTLAEARRKGREWLDLISRGIDPKVEEERQRAAQRQRQANTFGAVASDFLERHASKLSKSAEATKIIEREFINRWGSRPVTDIAPQEVSAAIRAIVKRGAPYQAHNAFGYLRKLFNWAIGTGEYGIDVSPLDRLQPVELIGKREARIRTLSDAEVRAVWEAAGRMGYPYGPVIRLLILTGQREREVADMDWSEIDLEKRLWTVPAARMKGDRTHEVPLAPVAVVLLESLPRWSGDFVFTTTGGAKPINGFSKAKTRIDKLSGISNWKIHDLRRTMRTHLSALPVEDLVRELVIAHAKPGLHKVYDQHAYQNEKRRCLELWEARLLPVVEPLPGEVTGFARARERRYEEI